MTDNFLDAPPGTIIASEPEDDNGVFHLIVVLRADQIELIAKAVAGELRNGNPAEEQT